MSYKNTIPMKTFYHLNLIISVYIISLTQSSLFNILLYCSLDRQEKTNSDITFSKFKVNANFKLFGKVSK